MIEFDGVPIRTSEEFLMRVRRALPYSTVKLTVMRPGEPKATGSEARNSSEDGQAIIWRV